MCTASTEHEHSRESTKNDVVLVLGAGAHAGGRRAFKFNRARSDVVRPTRVAAHQTYIPQRRHGSSFDRHLVQSSNYGTIQRAPAVLHTLHQQQPPVRKQTNLRANRTSSVPNTIALPVLLTWVFKLYAINRLPALASVEDRKQEARFFCCMHSAVGLSISLAEPPPKKTKKQLAATMLIGNVSFPNSLPAGSPQSRAFRCT